MTNEPITLVLTTLPNATAAATLADAVLAARLAACVTELAPARSRYHWQGQVETAEEIPLLFKTTAGRARELEQFIVANHPYDVPEVLSWAASASAAYGQWVSAETRRSLNV